MRRPALQAIVMAAFLTALQAIVAAAPETTDTSPLVLAAGLREDGGRDPAWVVASWLRDPVLAEVCGAARLPGNMGRTDIRRVAAETASELRRRAKLADQLDSIAAKAAEVALTHMDELRADPDSALIARPHLLKNLSGYIAQLATNPPGEDERRLLRLLGGTASVTPPPEIPPGDGDRFRAAIDAIDRRDPQPVPGDLRTRLAPLERFFKEAGDSLGMNEAPVPGDADLRGLDDWVVAVGLRTILTPLNPGDMWSDDAGRMLVREYQFQVLRAIDSKLTALNEDEDLRVTRVHFDRLLDQQIVEIADDHIRRSRAFLVRLEEDPNGPYSEIGEGQRELRKRLIRLNEFCGWIAPGPRWHPDDDDVVRIDDADAPYLRIEVADLMRRLLEDDAVADAIAPMLSARVAGGSVERSLSASLEVTSAMPSRPAAVSFSALGKALSTADLGGHTTEFQSRWVQHRAAYLDRSQKIIEALAAVGELTPESIGNLIDTGVSSGQIVRLIRFRPFRPMPPPDGRSWQIEGARVLTDTRRGPPGDEVLGDAEPPRESATELTRRLIETILRGDELDLHAPPPPPRAAGVSPVIELDLATEALAAAGAAAKGEGPATWIAVRGVRLEKVKNSLSLSWPSEPTRVSIRRGLRSVSIDRAAEDSAWLATAAWQERLSQADQVFWQDTKTLLGIRAGIQLDNLELDKLGEWLGNLTDAMPPATLVLTRGKSVSPTPVDSALETLVSAAGELDGLFLPVKLPAERRIQLPISGVTLGRDVAGAMYLDITTPLDEAPAAELLDQVIPPVHAAAGSELGLTVRAFRVVPAASGSSTPSRVRAVGEILGQRVEFTPSRPQSLVAGARGAVAAALNAAGGDARVGAVTGVLENGRVVIRAATTLEPNGAIGVARITHGEDGRPALESRRPLQAEGDLDVVLSTLENLRATWLDPIERNDITITAPEPAGQPWTVRASLRASEGGPEIRILWTTNDLTRLRSADVTIENAGELAGELGRWVERRLGLDNPDGLGEFASTIALRLDESGRLQLIGELVLSDVLPPGAARGVSIPVRATVPLLSPGDFSVNDLMIDPRGIKDESVKVTGLAEIDLLLSQLRLEAGRIFLPYVIRVALRGEEISVASQLELGLDGSVVGGLDAAREAVVRELERRINAVVAELLREKLGVISDAVDLGENLGDMAEKLRVTFDRRGWIPAPSGVRFERLQLDLPLGTIGPISGLKVALSINPDGLSIGGACIEAAESASLAEVFEIRRFRACLRPGIDRIDAAIDFGAEAVEFSGELSIPLDGNGRWAGEFDLALSGKRVAKAGLTIDPTRSEFGGSLAMTLGGVASFDGSLMVRLDRFGLEAAGSGVILGVDLGDAGIVIDPGRDRYGGHASIDFKFYQVAAGLYIRNGDLERAWGDFFGVGPVTGGVGIREYRPEIRATFLVTLTFPIPRFDEVDEETILNLFRNLYDPTRWLAALIPPSFSTSINLFGSGGSGGGGPGDGGGGGGGDSADPPADAIPPLEGSDGSDHNGWFAHLDEASQTVSVSHGSIAGGAWQPFATITASCPPAGEAPALPILLDGLAASVVVPAPTDPPGVDSVAGVVLHANGGPRWFIERDSANARAWDEAEGGWARCGGREPEPIKTPLPPLFGGQAGGGRDFAVFPIPVSNGWRLEVWEVRHRDGRLQQIGDGPRAAFECPRLLGVPRVEMDGGEWVRFPVDQRGIESVTRGSVLVDENGVTGVLVEAMIADGPASEPHVVVVSGDGGAEHAGWPRFDQIDPVLLTAREDADGRFRMISRMVRGGRVTTVPWCGQVINLNDSQVAPSGVTVHALWIPDDGTPQATLRLTPDGSVLELNDRGQFTEAAWSPR